MFREAAHLLGANRIRALGGAFTLVPALQGHLVVGQGFFEQAAQLSELSLPRSSVMPLFFLLQALGSSSDIDAPGKLRSSWRARAKDELGVNGGVNRPSSTFGPCLPQGAGVRPWRASSVQ